MSTSLSRARRRRGGAYPHNPTSIRSTASRPTTSPRRQRHRLFLAPAARADLAPELPRLPRRRGSGLRHSAADTHLLDWLEQQGIAYDVITDEDLRRRGRGAARALPGRADRPHPEYHTARRWTRCRLYRGRRPADVSRRQRLLLAHRDHRGVPGVIEVRRAEGGIRAWAAEPGEYYQRSTATTAASGGATAGRPELCGVGFTAQGLFEGSLLPPPGRRGDPRAAWIFEGVRRRAHRRLRPLGRRRGGLRARPRRPALGTPPNALVLRALGRPHRRASSSCPRSLLQPRPGRRRQRASLIRADMTYFETPAAAPSSRRLDHLLRQPLAQRLRQQRLPHPGNVIDASGTAPRRPGVPLRPRAPPGLGCGRRVELIEVRRLGPQIGAEISGVDVKALDDAGFGTIYRAWLDYNVVVVRGQDLADRGFPALQPPLRARRPAPVEEHAPPGLPRDHAARREQVRRRRQARHGDLPARRRGLAHRRRLRPGAVQGDPALRARRAEPRRRHASSRACTRPTTRCRTGSSSASRACRAPTSTAAAGRRRRCSTRRTATGTPRLPSDRPHPSGDRAQGAVLRSRQDPAHRGPRRSTRATR